MAVITIPIHLRSTGSIISIENRAFGVAVEVGVIVGVTVGFFGVTVDVIVLVGGIGVKVTVGEIVAVGAN